MDQLEGIFAGSSGRGLSAVIVPGRWVSQEAAKLSRESVSIAILDGFSGKRSALNRFRPKRAECLNRYLRLGYLLETSAIKNSQHGLLWYCTIHIRSCGSTDAPAESKIRSCNAARMRISAGLYFRADFHRGEVANSPMKLPNASTLSKDDILASTLTSFLATWPWAAVCARELRFAHGQYIH